MASVWVTDTVTGARRVPLSLGSGGSVSDFTYDRNLCAEGKGSATIQVASFPADLNLADVLEPLRNTLVLSDDAGTVLYAGMIDGDWVYDRDTITIPLVDMWGILGRRRFVDRSAAFQELWSISYVALSLGTLAKRAVTLGTVGGPATPVVSLPITLPADAAAATGTRTYYGYNFEFVTDIIADLMDEGLDVDFEPRWVSNALNWLMRVGQPLTGSTTEFYLAAPQSGVTNFKVRKNSSRVANNITTLGTGSGEDAAESTGSDVASAYPLLEAYIPYKQEADETRLGVLAAGDISRLKLPTTEISFDIMTTAPRLADTIKLFPGNDRVLGSTPLSRRLVGVSGSLGPKVSLRMQAVV